jgi:predicted nuclease of predicted toxin-antitoxin system
VWRLALDQNFNQDLFNAVKREYGESDLDVVRLIDEGLSEAPDEAVLEWAAQQGRIMLTHDVKTMVPLANARVREGLRMPGVIVVRPTVAYGPVIEDLCILLGASTPEEWEGRLARLPY